MPQLDALRALAVLCVFVNHLYFVPLRNYFPFGKFGVRLFFVLSGFLITSILMSCRDVPRRPGGRRLALKHFYARRFLRIFPAYYFALAAVAALGLPTVRETLFWHATYLSNALFARLGSFEGPMAHFWSLAVEEQFYLVWPVLILTVPRRWLVPVVGMAVVAGPAFRMATIGLGWNSIAAAVLLPGCLDTLALGALLAVWSADAQHAAKRRALSGIGLWLGVPLTLIAAYLNLRYGHRRASWASFSFKVFADLAFALVSVWLIGRAATGFGGLIGRVLQLRPLLFAGKISYGLYLYHMFCPYLFGPTLSRLGRWTANPHVYFVIMSALAFVLAWLSWTLLEAPINRLKRWFPYDAGERTGRVIAVPGALHQDGTVPAARFNRRAGAMD